MIERDGRVCSGRFLESQDKAQEIDAQKASVVFPEAVPFLTRGWRSMPLYPDGFGGGNGTGLVLEGAEFLAKKSVWSILHILTEKPMLISRY